MTNHRKGQLLAAAFFALPILVILASAAWNAATCKTWGTGRVWRETCIGGSSSGSRSCTSRWENDPICLERKP